MPPSQLPPLFSAAPIALVPAQTVAEFPGNTFLESIVASPDQTLFITDHYSGKVIRIDAAGVVNTHAIVAGKAAGLAFAADGSLLLTGWDDQNTPVVWRVSLEGTVDVLAALPDAVFLNGLTALSDSLYLIADSYRGAIWELDTAQGSARIWLEHPLLAQATPENPTPAVNGLKIFNQVLYASNTQNAQIVRIPIQAGQPGEPEVFVQNANIDDFAFDRAGNLYGTTHVFNSLVRIAPDGSITTLAQAEQGMVGTTAVAFGRSSTDLTHLYVTTNGGMSFPPPTGIESAKVVRLEVSAEGLPLL
ncbi:MAG: SMP-30/gluconolactonase/LRE family protein [Myxacorys californica WJT36-NPBG1]|jgi:sugar lactone lactonase YvrE|nr:SMP-30/gluconolactonase/LRE family protein [Myxacorys californica WJT36-NPBG1]